MKRGPSRNRLISATASAWISGVRSFASSSDTPLAGEWRRLGRERLCRIQHLARHVGRRVHRTLFNRPYRLAGNSVEHVGEALLGYLGHRVDLAAVHRDRHQVRCCRQVVVAHAVMHHLEVPLALARARVEGHQRLGEEVRPDPASSPIVAARRARRHVKEASLGIERHQPPHVGVAGVAPSLILPSVRPEVVARLRDGEEHPAPLARAGIERLHGAGRVKLSLHPVGHAAAHDHQVFEHHRRRGLVELETGHLPAMSLGQQDAPALAKVRVQLTVLSIDRVQPITAVEEDAGVVPVSPVGRCPGA